MSKILRRTFLDISNGYSTVNYHGNILYVRHLSHKEHLNLDELEAECFAEAKSKGLFNEKQQLDYLIKNDLWSNKKNNEIEQQKSYITSLKKNIKNVSLPSVLDSLSNQIKEAEKKLAELEYSKRELLGLTCESFAAKRVHEEYIIKSLFKDKKLTEPFISEEEFQDMSNEEMDGITILYGAALDICSDENIKKLSIQEFFQSYYFLCDDDLYAFWGKPIVDFTYLQVKLANNAKFFKQLFENNDLANIPDNVRGDPEKLISYIDTIKNGKEMLEKTSGDVSGIVGATKKDLELLGAQNVKSNPAEDMKEFMKYFPQ
jgi:hypothetical protein